MSIAPDKPLPSQLPGFAPTPEQTRQILHELDDPAASVYDLANRYKTDQESFCLWLARPEIAERVNVLESTVARRNRYVASNAFNAAVHAATRILYEFNYPSESGGNTPCPRETALRAARFLLRISQFAPGPVTPRVYRHTSNSTPTNQTHAVTPAAPNASSLALDPIALATQQFLAAFASDPQGQFATEIQNAQAVPPTSAQVNRQINHADSHQSSESDFRHAVALTESPDDDEEADDNDPDDEFTQPLSLEEAHHAAANLVASGILTPTQATTLLHQAGHSTRPTHPP